LIQKHTYVSFPQAFHIYSENVKLVEAFVEDLEKIGYKLDKSYSLSGKDLVTHHDNLDSYDKDIEKFKKITYCKEKTLLYSNKFTLPQQYLKALSFAKEQIESPYWVKTKFEKGDWLYAKTTHSEHLFRFSKQCIGNIYSNEYYCIDGGTLQLSEGHEETFYISIHQASKATNDQITRVLSRVARIKGYLENTCFVDNVHNKVFRISSERFNTFGKQDRLYVNVCTNDCFNKTASVYKDGIWAEIVNSEKLTFGNSQVEVFPGRYVKTAYGEITKEELKKIIDWINSAPSILSYQFTIHSSDSYVKITDNDAIIGFGCQKGSLRELKAILKKLK